MNGIGFNTFLLIMEQVTDGFDPQLLFRKSFDIFDKLLAFTSYWLSFMAKKPLRYPAREQILSRTNLLAPKKLIGEIARFFPNHIAWMSLNCPLNWNITLILKKFLNSWCTAIESYHGFGKIIFDLFFDLESMTPNLNNHDKQQLGTLSFELHPKLLCRTPTYCSSRRSSHNRNQST